MTELFFCCFFGRTSRSFTGVCVRRFLRGGLLGSLSPFPFLIPAVMKLLIGRLFLHPSIMSQIVVNTHVGTAALGCPVERSSTVYQLRPET